MTAAIRPLVAEFDPKRVVRLVLLELAKARVPVTAGSMARAEEDAQTLLRHLGVEPAGVPDNVIPLRRG